MKKRIAKKVLRNLIRINYKDHTIHRAVHRLPNYFGAPVSKLLYSRHLFKKAMSDFVNQ